MKTDNINPVCKKMNDDLMMRTHLMTISLLHFMMIILRRKR